MHIGWYILRINITFSFNSGTIIQLGMIITNNFILSKSGLDWEEVSPAGLEPQTGVLHRQQVS